VKRTCDNWQDKLPVGKSGIHLYEEFELRAKNVSTEVFHVKRADEAGKIILDIVKETGAKYVASVWCPLVEASGIVDELKDNGIIVYTEQIDIAENIDITDMGISGVAIRNRGMRERLPGRAGYRNPPRLFSSPPAHSLHGKSQYCP